MARLWTYDTPPRILGSDETPIATARGWVHPTTGEVLVAIKNLATKAGASNILSVELLSATGIYLEGENLEFEVTFNEKVDVDTSGGTPSLALVISSGGANTAKTAAYNRGTGTNKLVFRYVVTDDVWDAVHVNANISLNSGTIKDAGTNTNAGLTFSAFDVEDVELNPAPVIESVEDLAETEYVTDEVISISVVFDREVDVTGTPQVTLEIGGEPVTADYASGTGTDTLVFEYTVLVDDIGTVEITAIGLNSGTIKLKGAATPADLTGFEDLIPDTSDVEVNPA